MITWISKETDLIINDFNDIYNEIEPPLITEDGLFIQYYNKTPLYKGLVKNEMDVTGSKSSAIKNLNDKISKINMPLLTYKTDNLITLENLPWVKRLISIILYKLNYNIYNINEQNNIFTPTVQINEFTENIYGENYEIDVNSLIGYKPLIDIFDDSISLDIVSSDLIWTCDLSGYNYDVIYNIPVIRVNGIEDKSSKAKYIEFSMNPMLQLQSTIYSLMKNTFYYEKTPQVEKIERQYNFKRIGDFLQHDYLDRYWLDNYIKNKKSNVLISGNWIFEYKSNLKSMAFLKYASIRSYIDLYLKYEDIKIGFDLLTSIPIKSDDVSILRNNIEKYMSNDDPYLKITDKNDAIMTYILAHKSKKSIFLTFPIYDKWAVVGNIHENIKHDIIYEFDVDDEIIGINDFKVPEQLQKYINKNIITGLLNSIPQP